jgi:hypothetical protein
MRTDLGGCSPRRSENEDRGQRMEDSGGPTGALITILYPLSSILYPPSSILVFSSP